MTQDGLFEARMFPLGSVLFPTAPLPLHIFEPRYQELLNQSLEDDRTFGVVLISRGSEVGGGDQRERIGTLARIEEHQRFDDGRAAVLAKGQTRIEVAEWLAEDPFPRAMVRHLAEPSATSGDNGLFNQALASLQAMLATAEELGRLEQRPSIDWSDDIETATWQMAAIAPVGALDRQRLLAAERVGDRLGLLREMFDATADDLRLMGGLQ